MNAVPREILERIRELNFFDENWYLAQYPDVRLLGMDPLDHYLRIGGLLNRDPSPEFDFVGYRTANPDVVKSGVNPLLHYVMSGQAEGRSLPRRSPARIAQVEAPSELRRAAPARPTSDVLIAEHMRFTAPGPEFEEHDTTILAQVGEMPVKLIAFYLPQFHAIEENDRFWGKGFTEWRQLARSMPRFPGHYQPRIPRDLGHYNLLHEGVFEKQVEMAKASGIHAFAYYYYWFNGRRVLHQPLENLLKSQVDMPFMIIWANENWTKTWDGLNNDVLLGQDYLDSDEEAMLRDFARHFEDRRYMRIAGRPLFVIYRPGNIPDAKNRIERWRHRLQSEFGTNPLIFMVQGFGALDPRHFGLDGALEFPPHKLADSCPSREVPDAFGTDYAGRVIRYEEFMEASLKSGHPSEYPLIKTIVPSWDNDARRPGRNFVLEGISPAKYESWLRALCNGALRNPILGTPIVAVNAWNEWAEAAYLEPDIYFGAAFLNATSRVMLSIAQQSSSRTSIRDLASKASIETRLDSRKVTVIIPNFNHERFLRERIESVVNQTLPPDEIIFLDDASSDGSVALASELLRDCGIPHRIVPNAQNSGGVFRQWMKGLSLAKHNLIWVAESDDSASRTFLEEMVPAFDDDKVLAAYGRISYIDQDGNPLNDLDHYYQDMRYFNWNRSGVVPAYKAFSWDFAIKNVIPNASGLIFKRPHLSAKEIERLYQYKFAGDWYFYALVLRGGAVAYLSHARSFFRLGQSSTSRSAFFTERHLREHSMVVSDLSYLYGPGAETVDAHANALAVHFPPEQRPDIVGAIRCAAIRSTYPRPLRICIIAHSFMVGGGELVPVELANALKDRGHHVTYITLMRNTEHEEMTLRRRLRSDIPVVQWSDVADDFTSFIQDYGIDVINGHNVGVEQHFFNRRIRPGIPYVATLHGGYETVFDQLDDNFIAYAEELVSRWLFLADKNTAPLLKLGLKGHNFERSYNALPKRAVAEVDRLKFRRQHGIPADAFVLVQASRAIKEKGWQTSIDAVRLARERTGRPLHLVLIGGGPDLEQLKSANAGLDFVTFLGHVDDPSRIYRCFDMAVFPSVFSGESFPLFIVECFQAGLPVIASDVGEIPRMLMGTGGKQAGALVSASSGADAMAASMASSIAEAADDGALFDALRNSAIRRGEDFDIGRLAADYEKLFMDLADRRSQG